MIFSWFSHVFFLIEQLTSSHMTWKVNVAVSELIPKSISAWRPSIRLTALPLVSLYSGGVNPPSGRNYNTYIWRNFPLTVEFSPRAKLDASCFYALPPSPMEAPAFTGLWLDWGGRMETKVRGKGEKKEVEGSRIGQGVGPGYDSVFPLRFKLYWLYSCCSHADPCDWMLSTSFAVNWSHTKSRRSLH